MNEMQCTGAYPNLKCTVGPQDWDVSQPANPAFGPGEFNASTANDLIVQLRSGDASTWDVANKHNAERAEVDGYKYPVPFGTDVWLKFGLLIEPGPKVTSPWCVLGQLHPYNVAASPGWAQDFGDEVFSIIVRNNPDVPQKIFFDPDFERGRVYQFLYHLRAGTDGCCNVWRDGVEIVKYAGALSYPDTVGPYWKFGIYRYPALETLIVHYQDLQIRPTSS